MHLVKSRATIQLTNGDLTLLWPVSRHPLPNLMHSWAGLLGVTGSRVSDAGIKDAGLVLIHSATLGLTAPTLGVSATHPKAGSLW